MIKQEEVLRVFIRLFQQIPSTDFKTVTVPIQLGAFTFNQEKAL